MISGGGTIDTFEFRDGVSRLGLGLSEPQIQEMIECFDEDGNGEIEVRCHPGPPQMLLVAVGSCGWCRRCR